MRLFSPNTSVREPPAGRSSGSERAPVTDASASADLTIEKIISRELVTTLFQPVVYIPTREVVAFEALSRGPAGSGWESPTALLAAARSVERLGDLDWVCRATALAEILRCRLPASVSWFVNVEPEGFATPCPDRYQDVVNRARSHSRVVLEVVERGLHTHITDLLRATDLARGDAWGVALDDVGAEPGSLALLPFLQPDIVKLDMSVVQGGATSAAARISAAARAYAERTGAAILAEGIETDDQERLAVVYGATYAQGYLYGQPGPLPTTLPAAIHPIPLRQRPEPIDTHDTAFDVLAACKPTGRARLADLIPMMNDLGKHGTSGDDAGVLLTIISDESKFQARRHMLDEVAARNAFTACLIRNGRTRQEEPRYYIAPIPDDSRTANESAVIVVTPHFAGALVARELDTYPAHTIKPSDTERQMEFVFTHDRKAVIAAARAFLGGMLAHPSATLDSASATLTASR